jgi:hypothetical protein
MSSSWSDGCIYHRDEEANAFINDYFGRAEGSLLWVGGAGFDPRSTYIPRLLKAAGANSRGFLIREKRPRPLAQLKAQADGHEAELTGLFGSARKVEVAIFSEDEATVTGGGDAVRQLAAEDLTGITDILLDMTTLSVGVSFPLARWLHSSAVDSEAFPNVHVLAASSDTQGGGAASELLDRYQMIRGFDGDLDLDSSHQKARLWLPHLAKGKKQAMKIIHRSIRAEETCPILPFPSESPRMVENLIESFGDELRDAWRVDRRDFLYAAENDPLDLYQTILRIDHSRQLTYEATGGAVTLLSPLGSKVMAIGALMAALERNLPVVYVETQRYAVGKAPPEPTGVVHVWLTGSAYH